MIGDLRLRITIDRPPAGVAIQVQRGRDGLLAPTGSDGHSISFDLEVRVGTSRSPDRVRFLGEFAQGPAAARFIYVNSGVRAGQAGSCWERRAKVPLTGITVDQVQSALADKNAVLEARISGTGRDDGPMCGSVSLLGDGWTLGLAT